MYHQSMHRRPKTKWVQNDVVSRRARKLLCILQRAGATAYWKTQMNRHDRHAVRAQLRRR